MIKITHIPKQEEEMITKAVAKLIEPLGLYFEVKAYGNGERHAPTLKITKYTMKTRRKQKCPTNTN